MDDKYHLKVSDMDHFFRDPTRAEHNLTRPEVENIFVGPTRPKPTRDEH
jgi:hypothetical protein